MLFPDGFSVVGKFHQVKFHPLYVSNFGFSSLTLYSILNFILLSVSVNDVAIKCPI